MKNAKKLAYIRQLCCLDLPKEALVVEFLNAVKTVISSGNNVYTPVNEYGLPENPIFAMFIPEIMADAAAFLPAFFSDNWLNFDSVDQSAVVTDANLFADNLRKNSMYKLAWRPADQPHMMLAHVKLNNHLVGRLFLFRPRYKNAFTESEKAVFSQLIPYFRHAIADKKDTEDHLTYADTGRTAMIIAETDGNILALSPPAKELLILASYGDRHGGFTFHSGALPPGLVMLCKHLCAIFNDEYAPPPKYIHTNNLGRFIFRAHLLNPIEWQEYKPVGITIEHHEPIALVLMRILRDLPLSPKQKEVALLVAQNLSSTAICGRLNIKQTTLKDYLDKVYVTLDIHSRAELLPALLAMERTTTMHFAERYEKLL